MTQNEICPRCRSTYEIAGHLDFGANSIQVVNCPVCSQEKWIPSGLWPQQWVVGKVIDRQPVPANRPIPLGVPSTADPVWSNIEIPGADAVQAAGRGLYNIGIWIVVVLILIILIQYEPYITRELNTWDKN